MMNAEPSRTCPFCAEAISSVAKVCPRCRQWLSYRSLRNPTVAFWVNGLPLLIFFAALAMAARTMINKFNPEPYYTAFPKSIDILQSRLNWVQTSNGMRIYLTGLLTNQSPIAWKDVEFECRFFDPSGVMVDASHQRAYLTILPNDDTAFRVTVSPGLSTNNYAGYKLSVSTARNAEGAF